MSEPHDAEALAAVDYDPFSQSSLTRVVPTTEPQREVWLASQLSSEASLAYNESISLRLRGALDLEALRTVVQDVVTRHEALRATIGADGQDLCIADALPLDTPVIDLTGLSSDAREAAQARALREAVELPFDLEHGPLVRAELLRLSLDDHLLVFTAHHIVCDGWSYGVLVADLARLYLERIGQPGKLLPAADSFADYAMAQNAWVATTEHAADEAYWLRCFSGSIPVLDLPTDRPRATVRSFTSRRADVLVDADVVTQLRRLGARQGSSLFSALLAGFAATIARVAGVNDLVIGVPSAGQSVAGLHHLVGHCVNLLPLRLAYDPEATLGSAMSAAQSVMLDAFEHPQYTFGSLLKKLSIERDPSRLPLVSVMFNLDQALDANALGFPGLDVEFSGNPRHFENFELFVNAVQVDGGLRLECQYNSDLFDDTSVRRWLACFDTLLRDACARPETSQGRLAFVGPTDLALLSRWNDTRRPFRHTAAVHHLFEEQVQRAPQRIAVRHGDTTLTYAALDQRANRIAHRLRAMGVGRGALVGLNLNRDANMLAALWGVLKAGGAYVPLDPAYPKDRLAYMAEDAGLAALVTQQAHARLLNWPSDRTLLLGGGEICAAEPDSALPTDERAAQAGDTAYVIYTSGSTGKPKGVQVLHRNVVNYLQAMAREPGLAADDKLLAVTTLSFDIAVTELLLPLTVGAEIVLAGRDEALDGQRLLQLIATEGITVMQATPATWRLLLETGWSGSPRLRALCGGEALPLDLARDLLGRVAALWNMYGPTETTVWSTCCRIDRAEAGIGIGKPIDNTTVWVLDERLQTCPIGVPGEVYIGGDGVTAGYLHRPDLSAERFVADPFEWSAGARLYRSGDRGRWRADGSIEHLGRNDFQVKVRGFRIELGEIEAALLAQPDVARAVVVTREDRPGDVRLVAYVVAQAGAPLEAASVTAPLRSTLPDYMVPQHVVLLPTIPLLPNGKVDRHALPAPGLVATPRSGYAPPEGELEKAVAAHMEALLGMPGLGREDNFFVLGGHSLLAAQLASRLTRSLGVAVSLRTVFDAPTVAALADKLAAPSGRVPAATFDIPVRTDQSRAPASLMQQRLWFLEQLDPGRLTYNTPSAHRLTARLDVAALELAVNDMVRRQSILRTAIVDAGGEPQQVVLPELTVSLAPVEDLSGVSPAERESVLAARLQALTDVPFDLQQAPLFAIRLFRLSDEEHVLFFMPHHIIWDGWSFDLFYEELAELYAARRESREAALPVPAVSYGDFAAWHLDWMQGPELARQLAHWKERLGALPEPLDLPLDQPRPASMSGSGSTEWITLPKDLTEAARRLGQRADATLFMTLLTTYVLLLSRLTGQSDIVIGTPVRGRHVAELEKVMGFFVNALPLRLRIDPGQSFFDTLRHVRAAVLDSFAAPDVPFEQLVRELDVVRDESRSPIYQAFFSFQDARQRSHQWGNLAHEQIMLFQAGAAEDLGLWFLEGDAGLTGGLTYNTDVLSQATAARLRERFGHLLNAAMASPDLPVGTLDTMLPHERRQLADWNDTPAAYDRQATVVTLLVKQAAATPHGVALCSGDASLSYAELDARSNRLAHQLREAGIARGALVGLCVERGVEMVVAQIAVLKAGAAYVPLDPAYPTERVLYMAQDAKVALLLTESAIATSLNWPRAGCLLLDADAARIAAQPSSALAPDATHDAAPEDAAYVIYTSGSTGRPKGVVVPHRAVVNFLSSMAREPGLGAADRLVAVTTLSFDIAVLELLLPLTVGAQIVLAGRDQLLDANALRELVESSGATVMQATPSTWRMLIDAGWMGSATFKALVGGEALAPDLAAQLLARSGALWNMYGPTETTVWSTVWRVVADEPISIGRPIANTQVQVLDAQGQPCPVGVPGELCIGGDGVTTGYLHRPELTAERFIADPHGAAPGARLYRTGDRGRWRADGTLEHLGRLDFQVKVRGHRIELGEIEAQLTRHTDVSRAVVLVREDRPGDVRLVAYVVPSGAMPSSAELREHLRVELPDYMLPQSYVALESIPLLPNGKIDRKALPAPSESDGRAGGFSTPKSVQEIETAAIWSELLGVDRISTDDNFFDLGGHSLLAVRAAMAMEARLRRKVPVRRMIFETLGQIATDMAIPETPAAPESKAPNGLVGRLLRRLKAR